MRFAICIQNEITATQLSRLFAEYETQREVILSFNIFSTGPGLLKDFIPGEYDALFCGGAESSELVREVRERDAGVQLVRLFPVDADNVPAGDALGYCLPEQVSALFLFPVLDKLFADQHRLPETRLLIKKRGSMMYLPFSQIEYVEVCMRVVLFYLTDGRVEEAAGNFSDYEERMLQWPDFVKVHRSYIVNLRCVEKLTLDSLLTFSGHTVPISRLLYPQFKREYMNGVATNAPPPKHISPAASHPADGSLPTAQIDHTYRILLVDDQASELERWSAALQKKGCVVCMADTGIDALALAEEGSFDCVLLDVQLGNESGFDLCKALLEKTGAPVLYLSTLGDTEHQLQGFMTGGADYLTKDMPVELLWMKIERRIETAKAANPELVSGNLRVNLRTRQVFVLDQPLPLTSVEFDLLCLLMQNPNIAYTPERLYRLIWGGREWDDGHTVQMHMTLLCNRLEQRYPQHVFIDSAWGEGYRFIPET